MAKKDKDKEKELSNDESTGGKIVTVLIVCAIIIIWLAVFGVLIKLDVGNFGSEVLYPALKDVPVVNWILPEPAGALVSWVRNDRRGFPFWRERCSALILPHSILDLLCEKDNRDDSFTYLAEIIEQESVKLLRGLFLYDLVDELVVYQLPFSAGQGISVLNTFRPQHWELHKTTSFSNGICRLIYRKSCKM